MNDVAVRLEFASWILRLRSSVQTKQHKESRRIAKESSLQQQQQTTMAHFPIKVFSSWTVRLALLLLLLLADNDGFDSANAFQPSPNSSRVGSRIGNNFYRDRPSSSSSHDHYSTTLSMVKFNGEKWITEKPEETAAYNYPLINSLVLHGPKPFLTRLFAPNDYEQAILKFMASDRVDRINAQGNMDAYLQNPNDWAFNRMEEQKKGVKYDYVTLEAKQVVLVAVWSTIVLGFISRAVYASVNDVKFVRIYKNFVPILLYENDETELAASSSAEIAFFPPSELTWMVVHCFLNFQYDIL
jgi:hypothetical protein